MRLYDSKDRHQYESEAHFLAERREAADRRGGHVKGREQGYRKHPRSDGNYASPRLDDGTQLAVCTICRCLDELSPGPLLFSATNVRLNGL